MKFKMIELDNGDHDEKRIRKMQNIIIRINIREKPGITYSR
jgi:hypothetical protein